MNFQDLLKGQVGAPEEITIDSLGAKVALHQVDGDELTTLILESSNLSNESAIGHMAYWAARFTKGSKPTDKEVKAFRKNGAPVIKEIYEKGSQIQSASKAELEKN